MSGPQPEDVRGPTAGCTRPGNGRSGAAATAAWMLLLVAITVLAWRWLVPPASFDEAGFLRLAESRRFDEAEALAESYLRTTPADPLASFLLAQLLIERSDRDDPGQREADARRALERLDAIRPGPRVGPATLALYRGKALHRLDRWDAAESAWQDALRLDPLVPEAAWSLVDLYYLESRPREARGLALAQLRVEPDPRDRARLLVELLRQDAYPPSPASLVPILERVVALEPDGVRPAVALGLTLVHDSQLAAGLERLRAVVARHGDRESAWEGLLTALDDGSLAPELLDALERLPSTMAASPRFLRFFGRGAELSGRWQDAARSYRGALEFDPADFAVAVRLARVLERLGEVAEAERWNARIADYREARKLLADAYERADAASDLGVAPHPELARSIADLRRRQWRPGEAEAWLRLGPGSSREVLEGPTRPG